ncbi:MAG: cytochrome-c oxidase, partial [Hyphomicrobiales bacterium]|nr:cytochrome-c oxidase [Hyphomicrobiales bacterium]
DLHLILFSTGILALMAGGTIWILYNLAMRMMF